MVTLDLSDDTKSELQIVAEHLVSAGKGIFCLQESAAFIGKRLVSMGTEDTDENRGKYWKLFLTASFKEPLGDFISGMLVSDDALKGTEAVGNDIVEFLGDMEIMAGIQVDRGLILLMGTEDEATTQGLDNLGSRCEHYREKGIKFVTWRCVFRVGENRPSPIAVLENSNTLARFASECQKKSMVPVLLIELYPDTSATLDISQAAMEQVLAAVYKKMSDHNVFLEGTLLMISIVERGRDGAQKDVPAMAQATVVALQRTVPPAVPGIALLSGSLSEEESSVALDAINKQPGKKPWNLTFAFGRAMQWTALKTWAGKQKFYDQAQRDFIDRVKINCKASLGKYIEIPETPEPSPKASEHKGKKKK